MKILGYVVVLLIGGVIGFFVGGIGGGALGLVTGGIGGAELGVCSTIEAAQKQGMLTADQQAKLFEATAQHMRTELAEIADKAGVNLDSGIPVNAEQCAKLVEDLKSQM